MDRAERRSVRRPGQGEDVSREQAPEPLMIRDADGRWMFNLRPASQAPATSVRRPRRPRRPKRHDPPQRGLL